MIDLITNTFDFWFKIYNTILLFIAIWVRHWGTTASEGDPNNLQIDANRFSFAAEMTLQLGMVSAILLLLSQMQSLCQLSTNGLP